MSKRRHPTQDELKAIPRVRVIGTSEAAKLLGVTPQTIRNACNRWDIGKRMGPANQMVLSRCDIEELDGQLQTGSGNLTRSKK